MIVGLQDSLYVGNSFSSADTEVTTIGIDALSSTHKRFIFILCLF